MKSKVWHWLLVLLCAQLVACGSAEDGDDGNTATGGRSLGTSGGTTSSGGASGAPIGTSPGGRSSTGVVGGPGDTVSCGAKTCSPPPASVQLYACCMPDNACGGAIPAGSVPGADFGGAATSPCLTLDPGKPDSSCKSYKSAFGVTLAGCCGIDKVCGVNLSVAGLGCNNISAIASDAGPPLPCAG